MFKSFLSQGEDGTGLIKLQTQREYANNLISFLSQGEDNKKLKKSQSLGKNEKNFDHEKKKKLIIHIIYPFIHFYF